MPKTASQGHEPNFSWISKRDGIFQLSGTLCMPFISIFIIIFYPRLQVKIPVSLSRKPLLTALDQANGLTETFKIKLEFAHNFRKVYEQPLYADNDGSYACNKTLHKGLCF